MINFKSFRLNVLTESVVKKYRLGQYKVSVNKDGTKFVAYIDGDKFDSFKSVSDAESAIKDFVDLLDKEK
jgi:hypothetical protein